MTVLADYPLIEEAYRYHTDEEMHFRRLALCDRIVNADPETHMDEQEKHHRAALALLREVELASAVVQRDHENREGQWPA